MLLCQKKKYVSSVYIYYNLYYIVYPIFKKENFYQHPVGIFVQEPSFGSIYLETFPLDMVFGRNCTMVYI